MSANLTDAIVTQRFARSFRRLSSQERGFCEQAIARLLNAPSSPLVKPRPLVPGELYHEMRVGYGGRAIIRYEGTSAVLIDVLAFKEVRRMRAESLKSLASPHPEGRALR